MIAVAAVSIFATIDAPSTVTYAVQNENIGLYWDNPEAAGTISWDNGEMGPGGIGFGTAEFDVDTAIMFEPADLVGYNNYVFDYLAFYHQDAGCTYTLTVYQGGDSNAPDSTNMLSTQTIAPGSLTLNAVNYIQLANAVTINASQHLWIVLAYDCTTTGSYPAKMDTSDLAGTYDGKGNLINSGGWVGLYTATVNSAQITGNWFMRAYITAPATRESIPLTHYVPADHSPVVNNASPVVDASLIERGYFRDSHSEVFVEENSRAEVIAGYKIYKDGNLIETLNWNSDEQQHYFFTTEDVGQYTFNVTTLSEDLASGSVTESSYSSDVNVTVATVSVDGPPRGISFTVDNGNEPTINWVYPGEALGDTRLALPGDMERHPQGMSRGYGSFAVYEFGIRFTAQELQDYAGQSITNIRTVIPDTLCTYTLKIYEGGSVVWDNVDSSYVYTEGSLVHEQPVVNPVLYRVNIIDLDTPVQIQANNEYWIAFKVIQHANNIFPMPQAGNDGEINNRQGNLIKFTSWSSMYTEGEDMSDETDHYIQMYVSDLTTRSNNVTVLSSETYPECDGPLVAAATKQAPVATLNDVRTNDRADLAGWEVNWNLNTPDAESYTVDLQYTGLILGGYDEGDYDYSVSAVYDDQNVVTSDEAVCSIVLPNPDSLKAEKVNPNSDYWRLTWLPPNLDAYSRGFQKYNVYSGADEDNCDTFVAEADAEFLITATFDSTLTYKVVAVYGGGDNETFESSGTFWSLPIQGTYDNDIDFNATRIIGAYPNPFNPKTTIKYNIAKDSNVELVIYNIKGQKVRTLVNERKTQGEHSIVWNGQDDNGHNSATGVYFYRLKSGTHTSTQKLMMIK